MADSSEINWEAIAQNLPKSEDTRIYTGKLPDYDYWLLRAAAAAKNRPVAGDCASLLTGQCRRYEQEWIKLIKFTAAQHGVSFEEMFVRLANGS